MTYRRKHRRQTRRVALILAVSIGINLLVGGVSQPLSSQASTASAPGTVGPVGLVSDPIACLAVNSSAASAAGSISFSWAGAAQSARLVLNAAGAEAAQPVLVNGHWVGNVPAGEPDAPCGQGQAVYLDFAPSILQQGANEIEIGDAGQPGNTWTAANVRLEVLGDVQAPSSPPGAPSNPQSPAVVNQIISFNNHLDGSSQMATVQLPDGYSTANPVPLVIYAHARYGDMEEGGDVLGAAANTRGWLLASPQLHGHWPVVPNPPGAFAYASLESQYDILGTIAYLLSHSAYNVDRSRIYLVGYSMGGQIATVTGAKYPDVFGALFDDKGPTDFAEWYGEQSALPGHSQQIQWMRQECYTGSVDTPHPQLPAGNMFCYHRRSSLELARNLIHEPISITHSFDDVEVPITHSINLRDAINGFSPDHPVSIFVDTVVGPTCPPNGANNFHHCYEPDPAAVLTFLNGFTLNGSQTHLNLVSDESKAYYWLNIAQTGGDHWSYVEATANPGLRTVSLTVTDAKSSTIGVNLGSTPVTDWAGLSHPGLGYPAGTYHIHGAGLDTDVAYTNGYLQLSLPVTAQAVVTISPASFTIHQLFLPALLR